VDAYGTARLAAKEAESAIVARICEDFNLTPVLARAHYQQMARYFADYGHMATQPGELCYLAVDANEPSGKPIIACRKMQVRLALAAVADQHVLRDKGLAAMRQQRLARMPKSQLAVLPGTAHFVPPGFGLLDRAEWLLAMIPPFLDARLPETS